MIRLLVPAESVTCSTINTRIVPVTANARFTPEELEQWRDKARASAEAVEVIAHLVASERKLGALKMRGNRDDD